jgi:hypothetical protein
MSHAPSHADGHAQVASTESPEAGVNMKLIVGVGLASLVIFIVSAIIAAIILKGDETAYEQRGMPPKAKLVGESEIGIVDQIHFDADDRLAKWRSRKQHRLENYGWVDRKQGLIHIPIEQAMKEIVSRSGGGAQ